ncbi:MULTISPECIES: hypothetical protein [unclassified Rhizobium]|uniref:hypothetical protein n=1 Tax=unclassified Rhizobium TaxID=2613769 RepID=UPI00161F7F90|nr:MULTISPECIES: hypothetical protein [unclassified Rhizobium]MBB3297870.1 hypothetical protein [Rhizobium sp. BK112]MBB4177635.1 hypothetical protein [Rhizobium sp. BK109]
MSNASDQFDEAMVAYVRALAKLPHTNGDDSVEAAVKAAPKNHPVHRMSLRSYRCNGCKRLGVLADVMLDIGTGGAECPVCFSDDLHLVQEGVA